ncbi:F-box/LRR-repeat protein [Pyrus ussuriensis x Pyrus communis]|uniref:F-box/LRR-repeat protein n=1 Tax=Pyrus ussuriensis x Pyrus communis TaxID=2448454 RepID=A0A5N5I4Y1_9ROSA|nr:F-box/LRR-repeat protein [Pyrus ussuriensis x Pyrus communis]
MADALWNNECKVRNWADMDYNILVRIFMTLNFLDVILVSFVCKSWNAACCNPILWEKLDLTLLKFNTCNTPRRLTTWSDNKSSERLLKVLKSALRLSCGNLSSLVFHFSLFINDDHLICAAERTPRLKQLVLPTWNLITLTGFETAVRNWVGLESFVVAYIDFPFQIMKLVGSYCNISQLKVMCPSKFDVVCARAIVAYTPKLKILSLQCTTVHKTALVFIMNEMKDLEILNVSHCTFIDDSERPRYSYGFEQLGESIVAQVSRLKEFLVCPRQHCDMCACGVVDGEEASIWHRFEKEIWRKDKVSSLSY